MGGTISSKGLIEPSLKKGISTLSIQQIFELKENIDSTYAECFDLSKTEMENILSDKIACWEILYETLKGENERCDLYQMLAILVIFSSDQYSERLKMIFKLFDFDNSGDICLSELVLLFSSCISGLCKLMNTKPPNFESIKSLSCKAWNIIDTDFSGVIDYNEFMKWIENDEEIQEFLIYYQNFQTKEHAMNRYMFYMGKFITCFNASATPDSDKINVTFQYLQENFENLNSINISANIESLSESIKCSKVFEHLNYDDFLLMVSIFKKHGSKIHIQYYNNLIRAVSSFLATDLNNDKQISYSELKSLIWLIEGAEPSEDRLKREISTIDINRDDGIQLKEWIDYLLICDTVTGIYYFDHKLKMLFDKYDTDSNGCLSSKELQYLLQDSFKDQISNLDSSRNEIINGIIAKITNDIITETDVDKNKTIDWVEFKKGVSKIMKKKEYIEKLFREKVL